MARLLEKLGYDKGSEIIFIRYTLPLISCGVTSLAQTDICVIDDDEAVILLVKGDERPTNHKDPEP